MSPSRTLTAFATGALLAGGFLLAAPAHAVPKVTGCPSGSLTLSVADLIAQGYDPAFPTSVDLNGDGVICGKPLSAPNQERICAGLPGGCTVPIIYVASDNRLTPAH